MLNSVWRYNNAVVLDILWSIIFAPMEIGHVALRVELFSNIFTGRQIFWNMLSQK